MNRALTPITEVDSYVAAAHDLSCFLSEAGNDNIEAEFPGTLAQYSTLISAEQNLGRLIESHQYGVREIFLVCAGAHAVGQAIVTISKHPPKEVDPASPNVSGWISSPFQGRGLGKFSLEERLKVVRERFDGKAWTLVNKANTVSERNVRGRGFRCLSRKVEDGPQYNLFTWESV